MPSIILGPNTPSLTVGGQTFLAASAGLSIGRQTLAPGGAPVTTDGMSLAPSGKLVKDLQTMTLSADANGIKETIGGVVIDAPFATGSSARQKGVSSQKLMGSGERLRFSLSHCLVIAMAGLLMV